MYRFTIATYLPNQSSNRSPKKSRIISPLFESSSPKHERRFIQKSSLLITFRRFCVRLCNFRHMITHQYPWSETYSTHYTYQYLMKFCVASTCTHTLNSDLREFQQQFGIKCRLHWRWIAIPQKLLATQSSTVTQYQQGYHMHNHLSKVLTEPKQNHTMSQDKLFFICQNTKMKGKNPNISIDRNNSAAELENTTKSRASVK